MKQSIYLIDLFGDITGTLYMSYTLWLSAEAIDLGRSYWIPHPISCQTPEAVTTILKCSWGWTQIASETCRVLLQLLINILPSCITLVLCVCVCVYIYIYGSFATAVSQLQHCHNYSTVTTTTLSQLQYCHNYSTVTTTTLSQLQHCHNSKSVIFQEKSFKGSEVL
jgi:hypothetical protein